MGAERWYRVGTGITHNRLTAADWARESGFVIEVAAAQDGPTTERWQWQCCDHGPGRARTEGWERLPDLLPPWMRLFAVAAPQLAAMYATPAQRIEIDRIYRAASSVRHLIRGIAARDWVSSLRRKEVAA